MIMIMLSSMDNAVSLQGCIKIKSGLHFPFHYFMDSDRLNLLLIIIGGSVNDWSVKIYLILLGPLRLCVCLINCVLRLSWDCFPIIGVVLTGQWLKPPSLGIKVMSAFQKMAINCPLLLSCRFLKNQIRTSFVA